MNYGDVVVGMNNGQGNLNCWNFFSSWRSDLSIWGKLACPLTDPVDDPQGVLSTAQKCVCRLPGPGHGNNVWNLNLEDCHQNTWRQVKASPKFNDNIVCPSLPS